MSQKQLSVRLRPPPARILWVRRIAILVMVSLLLTGAYRWASPRAFPRDTRFGFGFGALHGALMPMALPALLLGQDVEIYASDNSGRPYKLGYIVGINGCGLLFFGSAFLRFGKLAPTPQSQREGNSRGGPLP